MLLELGKIDTDFLCAADIDTIEAAVNDSSPAGQVSMYMGTGQPVGWFLINGQVVVDCLSGYPDLWAVMPAPLKVGADLHLPDATQRIPLWNGGTPGSLGGSSAITYNNLPEGPTSTESVNWKHVVTAGGNDRQFIVQTLGVDPIQFPHAVMINAQVEGGALVESIDSVTSEFEDVPHTHFLNTSGTQTPFVPAFFVVQFMVRAY